MKNKGIAGQKVLLGVFFFFLLLAGGLLAAYFFSPVGKESKASTITKLEEIDSGPSFREVNAVNG